MLTASAIVFAVNILTSFLKKVVFPKFGNFGVQVIVFVLALIGALYMLYNGHFPALATWVGEALKVFAAAVAFYEVILKNIPLFSKPEAQISTE